MNDRWEQIVRILIFGIIGLLLLAAGVGGAEADTEIINSNPDQCTELDPGTTQEFELTVDYDLGGETPGHIKITVSEEGYGSTTDEVDLSGYDSDDQVTFMTEGEIGDHWEEASVKISVYGKDSDGTSEIDEAYYDIVGSSYTCDPDPETIVGHVYDEEGENEHSGALTIERLSDGERELVDYGERQDGFFEYTDQSLLEPGEYRLAIYPDDSGYPPYWGYQDIELNEGEYKSISLDRGGVYTTEVHAIDSTGSKSDLQFEPGSEIEFELDVQRPRNGDEVAVETYLYPSGEEPDNNPDAVYEHGPIDRGPSTLEFKVPAPQSEGEYDVEFVVKTKFSELDNRLTTDVSSGPSIEVAELEPPQVVSKTPKQTQQKLVGYNELAFSLSTATVGDDSASIEWFVDDEYITGGDSMILNGADYEPGEYEIRASISDGIDETDDVDETWTVTVNEPVPPEIDSSEPTDESFEILSGGSKTFSVDANTNGGGELTYEWFQNENLVGTGDNVTQSFDRGGQHTIAANVTDEWGSTSTKTWDVEVQSFRDDPRVSTSVSTTQFEVQDQAELLTISVQNPAVNERTASVEVVTEPPSGVEVSGSHDATYGDSSARIHIETIEPGEGTSMRVDLRVSDDSLKGETISVPYQIQYYPDEKRDDYHTEKNTTQAIDIEDIEESSTLSEDESDLSEGESNNGTDDSVPGFTAPLGLVAIFMWVLYGARPQH